MKIFIPKEINNENRVAATPDSVKKFISMGHDVIIEPSAGVRSNFGDDLYMEVGASISDESSSADIILKVGKPLSSEVAKYKDGSLLIAMLDPYNNRDLIDELRNKNITTFAMEWMPRITRAQSMDVLSSQSNLSGYKAVIEASSNFNKAMPMMMTAAGTIAPAKIFIMGVGVAVLQAIATAKRMGAVVSATDVRRAAGEQCESLGASLICV
jgi:NAD(P) transhydrogenase subunit alpha